MPRSLHALWNSARQPGLTMLSDDDIHERLIEAVIDQRLLPGTRLAEDKLGQVFGVPRTRIHQILIRLAREQVVTLDPRQGATVAQPTMEDAREVFEARALIEAVLVKRFMERATPGDLAALTECIEAEEEARREADQADALRLSVRFHLLIAGGAQHQTFTRMLKKLMSRTSLILMSYAPAERASAWTNPTSVRWVEACRCDGHRGLLAALRAREPLRLEDRITHAAELMRAHLAQIEEGLCFNQPEMSCRDVADLLTHDRMAWLTHGRMVERLLEA